MHIKRHNLSWLSRAAWFRLLPMLLQGFEANVTFRSYKTLAMPSKETENVPRPQTPLSQDFAAQQRQKQLGNNYHSSSLAKMINPNSVNKTNLHPGGVE